MNPSRPLMYWAIAFATAVPAVAAPVAHPITPAEIAEAANRSGFQVAPQQVMLLSNAVATTGHPELRVQSVQRWNNDGVMIRLACTDPKQCLPFLVALRNGGSTATTGEPVWAVPSDRSAPLVHTGDSATLLLEGDHVHIRIRVICLQNGNRGQTIRAATADHRIVYTADVVDRGLLRGRL